MRSNAIQNINNTGYRQKVLNTSNNKPYKQIAGFGTEDVISANPFILHAPCDTKLLIKNYNVSFSGSNEIKTLSPEELKDMIEEVKRKLDEFNIKLSKGYETEILNPEYERSDVTIQLMNMLLHHKIIELDSVKHCFNLIVQSPAKAEWDYSRTQKIMDFVDYITKDENKAIYENKTVQAHMGEILFELTNADIAEAKIALVEYLKEHNELLSTNRDIGLVLRVVKSDNFELAKKVLSSKIKMERALEILNPEDPDLKNSKNSIKPPSKSTNIKRREPLGQIVAKTSEN